MKKGGNGLVHLSLPIKSTHLAEPNKKTQSINLITLQKYEKKLIAVILCN
ncbi:hypothetical protein ACIXNY_05370 [Bacteroides fragilis]